MELGQIIGNSVTELNPILDVSVGSLAGLLLIMTLALIYSGVPISLAIAGTALLFAMMAMITGVINLESLSPFAKTINQILSSQTFLSIPLFLFAIYLLKRAGVVPNLIKRLQDHWHQKSYGILYTASFIDLCLLSLGSLICALLAPLTVLRLPNILIKKRGQNNQYVGSNGNSEKNDRRTFSYIPAIIILVLTSDLILKAAHQLNLKSEKVSSSAATIVNLSARDFLSSALLPLLIVLVLVFLWQVFRMFKNPRNYVVKQNDVPIEQLKINARAELFKDLIPPFLFCGTILFTLFASNLQLLEISVIAVMGSLFVVAIRIGPDKKNIFYNTAISVASIFILGHFIALGGNEFAFTPVNLAVLSITIFFFGYTIYGTALMVKELSQITTINNQNNRSSFLAEVTLDTFLNTSQIILTLLAASLFLIVYQALGGDQLSKAFNDAVSVNSHLAVGAGLLMIMFVAIITSPLAGLLIGGAILIPNLLLTMSELNIANYELWVAVAILLCLQIIQTAKAAKQEITKGEGEYFENKANPILKIHYIIIQMILLGVIWYFPSLIQKI